MPSTTLSKHALLHEQTRAGAAALAMVEEDRAGGAGDGGVDVGIGEDDVGGLAAQFQASRVFRLLRGGLHDQLADFGRAGEGDLVDIGVRGQRRAGGLAEAGYDVDHAIREAGFRHSSPSRRADSGVCSAGFSTTVQPVASAGPSFQAAISSGKFHGMIWPTTPTGSRTGVGVDTWRPAVGHRDRMVLPSILVAQPAM